MLRRPTIASYIWQKRTKIFNGSLWTVQALKLVPLVLSRHVDHRRWHVVRLHLRRHLGTMLTMTYQVTNGNIRWWQSWPPPVARSISTLVVSRGAIPIIDVSVESVEVIAGARRTLWVGEPEYHRRRVWRRDRHSKCRRCCRCWVGAAQRLDVFALGQHCRQSDCRVAIAL